MTLKPSQAARDAFAELEEMYPPHMGGEVFRDGMADEHPGVQILARFERDILARAESPVVAEAWLIRKIRGGVISIVPGRMFKSERAARAAAVRLTNQWWLCQAFPVASLAAPSTPSEQS